MALTVGELVAVLTIDDAEFQSKTDSAGTKLQNVGKKSVDTGKSLTKGVSLPLAAVGTASFMAAKDWETNLTKMTAIARVPQEQVQEWEDDMRSLAREYGVSGAEAAKAMFFISEAGLEGDAAMEALERSLMGSAAGFGTTEEIAGLAASAIAAYGEDVIGATEATDILAAAASKAVYSPEELGAALTGVIPTAAEMGVEFDELAGIMSALAPSVNSASEAGTRVNAMMSSLLAPSQQAATILDDVGLSTDGVRQSIDDDGLLATLRMLEDSLDGDTEAMANVLGSSEALQGALGLLGRDADEVDEIMQTTANSAEYLDDAFDGVSETADFQMRQSMAEVQDLLLEIGLKVLPIVVEVLQTLTGWLERVADWWRELDDGTQENIIKFGILVAAIGPVLIIFGKLIGFIGSAIIAVGKFVVALYRIITVAVQVVMWLARMGLAAARLLIQFTLMATRFVIQAALMTASATMTAARVVAAWALMGIQAMIHATRMAAAWLIAMGPVGWIIAAIIALAALIFLYWDEISEATTIAWEWIVGILASAWEWIVETATLIWEWIVGIVTTAWDWISETTQNTWDTITGALGAAWDWIWGIISTVVDWIVNAISTSMNTVSSVWTSVWNGIKNFFGGIVTWIQRQFTRIVNFAKKLPGRISSAVSGLWDGIKSGLKTVLNWIIDQLNSGIGAINSLIDGANKVPGVNIPTIPEIPGLATGGHVIRDGLALVGEEGPELLHMPQGAAVQPLRGPTAPGGGNGGGGAVSGTILIKGDGILSGIRQEVQVQGGNVQAVLGGR